MDKMLGIGDNSEIKGQDNTIRENSPSRRNELYQQHHRFRPLSAEEIASLGANKQSGSNTDHSERNKITLPEDQESFRIDMKDLTDQTSRQRSFFVAENADLAAHFHPQTADAGPSIPRDTGTQAGSSRDAGEKKLRTPKRLGDPEQQKLRTARIKRISYAKTLWSRDTEKHGDKIEELNEAEGTDKEIAVVNKYISEKQQRPRRTPKNLDDPERQKERRNAIRRITNARTDWSRDTEKHGNKLQELEEAEDTEEETAVVEKYRPKK